MTDLKRYCIWTMKDTKTSSVKQERRGRRGPGIPFAHWSPPLTVIKPRAGASPCPSGASPAIVNSAAINIGLHESSQIRAFSGYML